MSIRSLPIHINQLEMDSFQFEYRWIHAVSAMVMVTTGFRSDSSQNKKILILLENPKQRG